MFQLSGFYLTCLGLQDPTSKATSRGSIYTTIMEIGTERPFLLWFWGPNSIMEVYVEPLGHRTRESEPCLNPETAHTLCLGKRGFGFQNDTNKSKECHNLQEWVGEQKPKHDRNNYQRVQKTAPNHAWKSTPTDRLWKKQKQNKITAQIPPKPTIFSVVKLTFKHTHTHTNTHNFWTTRTHP